MKTGPINKQIWWHLISAVIGFIFSFDYVIFSATSLSTGLKIALIFFWGVINWAAYFLIIKAFKTGNTHLLSLAEKDMKYPLLYAIVVGGLFFFLTDTTPTKLNIFGIVFWYISQIASIGALAVLILMILMHFLERH